jgi:hypothetical protein
VHSGVDVADVTGSVAKACKAYDLLVGLRAALGWKADAPLPGGRRVMFRRHNSPCLTLEDPV